MDAATALRWVTGLASLGVVVSTLELLVNHRMLSTSGIHAWSVIAPRFGSPDRAVLRIFRYPAFLSVLALRLVAASLLLVSLLTDLPTWLVAACATTVLAGQLLQNARLLQPQGSDNMEAIVWGTLTLVWLLHHDPSVASLGLWFLGIQACLSYWFNGIHKVSVKQWRDGSVFRFFVSHALFGLPGLAERGPLFQRLGRLAFQSALVIELLFPLVMISGPKWCWLFLGWGLAFHLINAAVMGINTFVFPFAATYPAILFCVHRIHGWWP